MLIKKNEPIQIKRRCKPDGGENEHVRGTALRRRQGNETNDEMTKKM